MIDPRIFWSSFLGSASGTGAVFVLVSLVLLWWWLAQ